LESWVYTKDRSAEKRNKDREKDDAQVNASGCQKRNAGRSDGEKDP
jgi:hypothetical protein